MIISMFRALVGMLELTKILCAVETIYCPQDLRNTQYHLDVNSTLLLKNTELILYLQDDFKLYVRDTSTVDIIVYDALATLRGDMYRLDLSTQQTSPLPQKYVEYNYEVHGLAKRVVLNEEYSELDDVRVVAVPFHTDDIFGMPDSLRYGLQKQVETCLELQIHFELNRIHKEKFLQFPSDTRSCGVPELPYISPSTARFQDVINKAADVVIHKIIEEFVYPVDGQIEAPELSIEYRQYIFATGSVNIFNGTLRDLRTAKRRSDITVSRDDQFLILSGSFDIKNVSVIYNDYTMTGTIALSGNNITVNFKDGVIVDAIVYVDTNEFPCGIRLHQLRLSSEAPGEIEATDASSLINSSVKDEFVKQNVTILEKFADKLKEYVESQMDRYDCKTVRVLDFLEKSLNNSLNMSIFTEHDEVVDYYKNLFN